MNRMLGPGDNVHGEILMEPADGAAPANPLLKVHQLLRGRYRWAIPAALLLGLVTALTTYNLPWIKPDWKSPGQILIHPALDPILYATAFNERMPDYDQFVETQLSILKSQRIILRAMNLTKDDLDTLQAKDGKKWTTDDRTWSDVASAWRGLSPDEQMARYTDGLDVSHPRNSQVILITFTDKQQTLAPVAVKLVIAAYKDLYDTDVNRYASNLNALDAKQTDLVKTVKDLTTSVRTAAGEYASEDFLQRSLEQKQTDLLQANRLADDADGQVKSYASSTLHRAQDLFTAGKLTDAEFMLGPVLRVWPDLWPNRDDAKQLQQQIADKGGAAATASALSQPLMDLTPELAAATDPFMGQLIKQRFDANLNLQRLKVQVGAQSPAVRSAEQDLAVLQHAIDDRLDKIRAQASASLSATGSGGLPVDAGKVSLVDLNERLKAIKDRRDQIKGELGKLQAVADRVQSIAADLHAKQQELDAVKAKKEQLVFEGVRQGRTEVISPGDRPLRPDKDRRMPAAAAGGFGGLALGLGIFALIGLMDRRVRSIADARDSLDGSSRILGILPALPENLDDPEQASAAAFAVHHIRTLLQLAGGGTRSTVFAVTSAAPQDGKTSLVTALGMSYAASGSRTLLIDADVIGGGLSSRQGVAARPRLGGILVRKGLISRDQLETGLELAQRTGTRTGQALVNLGFIKAAELEAALAAQAATASGFLDMLDGQALADCMVSAGSANLWLMPVGNVGAKHVGQISVDAVRRIIAEARKEFDTVLFDTGPLLGSLEAGIVAASVDEVIVAVSRGQQRPLLDQTFRRLEELGARVAGIVFNRAQIDDIERSGYASSVATSRVQSPALNGFPVQGPAVQARRLGPVARALDPSKQADEAS